MHWPELGPFRACLALIIISEGTLPQASLLAFEYVAEAVATLIMRRSRPPIPVATLALLHLGEDLLPRLKQGEFEPLGLGLMGRGS